MRWFKQPFSRPAVTTNCISRYKSTSRKSSRTWSQVVCRGKSPRKPRAVSLEM